MAKRFFDKDARPELLIGKTIGVIGYGNQGRAQSLNLRDSGCKVIIGNAEDDYATQARQDGMVIMPVADAVKQSDIILFLIPDEVQPSMFKDEIEPSLRPDAVICFASGYNIFFDMVKPAPSHDVIMVAPRMLGDFVRKLYVKGQGFPTFVAAHQNASGHALDIAVAIAHAIGGTKVGALEATFEEETVLDLFLEQVMGPAGIASYIHSFELFTEKYGYDPEVVQLELYGSGEGAIAADAVFRHGLLGSLAHESPTANFGTFTKLKDMLPQGDAFKADVDKTIQEIRNGSFAKLWSSSTLSRERIAPLREEVLKHPIFEYEKRTLEAIFGNEETVDVADKKAVEETVGKYLEAAKQGDTNLMKSVFHEEAKSLGYAGDDLVSDTTASLLTWLEQTGASPNIRAIVSSVDIVKSMASVKVEIKNWAGDNYTDFLTLLKTNDGWKIVGKMFHLHN
jgi:ketol-acid reductoisomerase